MSCWSFVRKTEHGVRMTLLAMKDEKMRSSASAGLRSGSRPVGMMMKTVQRNAFRVSARWMRVNER